ncbi:uncharacterized protein LOC129588523 isoform X2 [Paramacrobiotus metropolitanus]|uniref:uncharacterized protein LOC129588523 isoform X2 n=1 Tax=Paramacrobiotus metropolitanus TaxID=2943436 RepID=UPI0024463B3A|nr:uncharacterized protein LOC129588523 isoform X2 [Paramacrobiotus metropolitanus]
MFRLRWSLKPSCSIIILSFLLAYCRLHCVEGEQNTVYAILGSPAIISCNGYDAARASGDNSTGNNVTEIFSVRWFKDHQTSDYIVFTFLHMFSHKTMMPQNEWKDRNITFAIQDQPQIRLPNVTFKDEANYICDLTLSAGIKPIVSETRLKVVACPETVDVAVINSTSPGPAMVEKSGNNNNNITNITLSSATGSTLTFLRGTRIMVRCSAVSYPEAGISISIPGLNLYKPDWENLRESPGDHGYVQRTLDAWFTLEAADNLLRSKSLTIDCKASVANGTCDNTSSLSIQFLLPTTKTSILTGGLTNAQIAGIVIGCLIAVSLIGGLVYLALRQTNKDTCKKSNPSQGYCISAASGKEKKKHSKKDISHPKAITAYPPAPCPKTGSVSFVDASALL